MSPPLFRIVAGNAPVSSELVESAQRVLPLLPYRHRRRLRDALPELAALDQLSQRRRHAQRLQNRLFGRLADCVIEPGPHTFGALMHGLSMLRVFLFLRRLAPTRITPNRRAREADLQVKFAGRWLDIDIRPREPAGQARERYLILDRSQGGGAGFDSVPQLEGYAATLGLYPSDAEGSEWRLVGSHLQIEDVGGLDGQRSRALRETIADSTAISMGDIQVGFTSAHA